MLLYLQACSAFRKMVKMFLLVSKSSTRTINRDKLRVCVRFLTPEIVSLSISVSKSTLLTSSLKKYKKKQKKTSGMIRNVIHNY